MKKFLAIVLPLSFIGLGFYFKAQDAGEDVLLRAIVENLKNMHYDPVEVNDDFSGKAFDLYVKRLDPNKRFIYQSDFDDLSKFKTKIDDETLNGSYEFFDKSDQLISQRISEVAEIVLRLLEKPFDLNAKESIDLSDDIPYVKSKAGLTERWRKFLKLSIIERVYTDLNVAKSDSTAAVPGMDSLERKARASILKTHKSWFERLAKVNRKDRLTVYVNSITSIYDPHTSYFPPKDKENFDIRMSGQLEGIGAQLQEKDGYIKVTNVIPGGPASMEGSLSANDLILKVAQENEEPVDIVDWRIDDAVKLIRGKKGTKVTLTVKKSDGSVDAITIIRDLVVLEETYAKSLILNDKSGSKVGLINLPSFYADFSGRGGRSSWKDVKAEIEKLKSDQISGIIIDLRNNGGGSLSDVVQMAGLFIDEGPVVQVKQKQQSPYVMKDQDPGLLWDGALVIMVNEFSASASEILAAAMQDYGRAVIIGSSSTHGKGTVQRFIKLNQTLRSKDLPDLGQIKLTTQKFYRINGKSTQLQGVQSDVLLPDNYMYIKTGEKEHDYPMLWDSISPAKYKDAKITYSKKVIAKSNKRIGSNATFNLIEENARRWEKQSTQDVFTLNFKEYQAQEDQEKAENKEFKKVLSVIPHFDISNLSADEEFIKGDSSRMKRNSDWIKSVSKDPYLYEALQICQDWN